MLALPHLPPPIPTLVTTSLKYLQMGNLFLDDIAALVFGLGLIVWLGSWWSSQAPIDVGSTM
jgi:GET complex subunit GET2